MNDRYYINAKEISGWKLIRIAKILDEVDKNEIYSEIKSIKSLYNYGIVVEIKRIIHPSEL